MKRHVKFALGWLVLVASAQVGAAEVSTKLSLELKDRRFNAYAMEFSVNGELVCIAGTDRADAGGVAGRVILIDRTHHTVLWQKTFPVPDGNAGLFPVQCRVSSDHVYLLANVDTKSTPTTSQTLTYLYSFDLKGQQTGMQALRNPARNQYGYALDLAPEGLKVAGYLKDEDEDFEYYSVYTLSLSPALQAQGDPVVRKTGAYTWFLGARIVGDSLYVAGTFAPAKVARNGLIDDFAASRLRLAGGYVWSARTQFGTRSGVRTGVAEDGTVYALRYTDSTTTLLTVPPGGKPLPLQSYVSRFCNTKAIAGYGKGLLAVREPCSDQSRSAKQALLEIDPITGKETELNWIGDEPIKVATQGSRWAVITKDKEGKLSFYSSHTEAQ
ncbi:hypothetical protein GTP91_08365 [Rugamonas sp. FT82W]|uniref:Uncharacterized protein n=1 Tax=Duganella vulcania TaxID=2692166 RepID=A0A845G2I5_9BURK|nr:hypothetical protein [Duganella vulcania]MYM87196.1 hypothetical protein [Duganella vulcania]